MSEDALRADDRSLAHRDRDSTTITDDGLVKHGDASLDATLVTDGNTETEVDVVGDDGIPADAHVLVDRHAAADARGRVDLGRGRDGIPSLKATELLHDALALRAEIRARERLRRKAGLGIVAEVGNARDPMLDPGARLAIEILIGALADVLLDHGATIEMRPHLLARKIAADMLHSLRSLMRLNPGPRLAGPVGTIEEDTGLIVVKAEQLASDLARSRRIAVLSPHRARDAGSTFRIELDSQTIEPGDGFGTFDAAEAAARVEVEHGGRSDPRTTLEKDIDGAGIVGSPRLAWLVVPVPGTENGRYALKGANTILQPLESMNIHQEPRSECRGSKGSPDPKEEQEAA